MPRKCTLGLIFFGLTAVVWLSQIQAWEKPPIKIDAAFNFKFNILYGPTNQYKAPWYAYFPYDPNLQSGSGGNPYPNWPTTFPPREGEGGQSTQTSRFPTWPAQFPGTEPDRLARSGQIPGSPTSMSTSCWQGSRYSCPPAVPASSLAQFPGFWYGH